MQRWQPLSLPPLEALAAAYAVTHGLLETRHDHHRVRAIFAKHKIRFDYNGYNITSPM